MSQTFHKFNKCFIQLISTEECIGNTVSHFRPSNFTIYHEWVETKTNFLQIQFDVINKGRGILSFFLPPASGRGSKGIRAVQRRSEGLCLGKQLWNTSRSIRVGRSEVEQAREKEPPEIKANVNFQQRTTEREGGYLKPVYFSFVFYPVCICFRYIKL